MGNEEIVEGIKKMVSKLDDPDMAERFEGFEKIWHLY